MKRSGLYVHIPFCRRKCPYCAFFSVPSQTLVPRWLAAFKEEVAHYSGSPDVFDSLYLGGGTPTVLDMDTLQQIMDCLHAHFTFDPGTETTLEANPSDLTPHRIRAFKGMGFNRVSLGVQSFDDRTLAFLGRGHTARHAEKALADLRTGGFENISMDLIYGFRGQTTTQWRHTLDRALGFGPEHLSCYQLTLEDRTVFGRLGQKGMSPAIGEAEARDFFLATAQTLEANEYIHYEISSFARGEAYYARHNHKYWRHAPYLGLGPSAHSFRGTRRWWNVRSVRRYCEAVERGIPPVEGSEDLSEDQLRMESIMLGLRTKQGLDQDVLVGHPPSARVFQGLRDAGFVSIRNGRVAPTRKGFVVADALAACLLS